MLTRLYVEALLIDEELADQVWELWNAGVITDEMAAWAWCILAVIDRQQGKCRKVHN
jgi:hypothetical protein